jgi:hypothetical protein
MENPRFLILACLLLFISFTSLYIFFSPSLATQPWDSLAYAYSAEENGIRAIWGNHPLGHFIFSTIYNAAEQIGYEGRALPVFKTVNGILGGMIVAVFYAVLTKIIGTKRSFSFGFSLLLGTSYAFWYFAGTAEIYHFSILFSLLAWAAFINEIAIKKRPVPILSGILAGLAILFHQLNTVLIPVGLAFIFLTSRKENQAKNKATDQVAVFLGVSTVTAALGTLLLGFVATSSFSLPDVFDWMRGYFGDPTYGRYLNFDVFKTAWLTMAQAVLFPPKSPAWYISSAALGFLAIMTALGIRFNKRLATRKRIILAATALHCFITWPLILWWEPWNPKFWLLTLIPWMILLALSFEAMETTLRQKSLALRDKFIYVVKIAPFAISILLLSINLPGIASGVDDAGFTQAMNLWLDHSGPDDVLITAGDLIPQLRYWGQRPNTIFLYRSLQASQDSSDSFYALDEQIKQALCTNHNVLITPTATDYIAYSELSLVGVSRKEVRSYLYGNASKGEIIFWYRNTWDGKLLPVYALKEYAACLD